MIGQCSLGYCATHCHQAWLNGHLWRVEFDLNRPNTVILSRQVEVKNTLKRTGGVRMVTIRRSEYVQVASEPVYVY